MKLINHKNKINFLTSFFGGVIILSFVLTPVQNVFAERMTSGNYTLQSDSVNFEGGRSTSGSYTLENTAGEVGTGDLSSANSTVRAGFQQNDSVSSSTQNSTSTQETTSGSTGSSGSIPSPVNVVNFTATPLEKSIGLSWIYPQGANITSVRIVRSDKFFPGDINDGTVIFEGNAQAAIDNDVKIGTRYYYALFTRNQAGEYSSGVLAQAIITPKGEQIVPVTPGEIFENVPPAKNIDPIISALTLLDFDFIQDGRKITPKDNIIPIDGKKNLTIRLAYTKVPEILKTIAITLTDPEDKTRVFSFLLRVNKDKTAYEATIAPLGRSGDYRLDAIILDYKNQGLKRLNGSLHALLLADAQSALNPDGKNSSGLLLMIIFLILAFIAVIILVVVEKRKKEKKANETMNNNLPQ